MRDAPGEIVQTKEATVAVKTVHVMVLAPAVSTVRRLRVAKLIVLAATSTLHHCAMAQELVAPLRRLGNAALMRA